MRHWILIFALLGSAAQAGTVYRWVDENGTVHYSDSPRSGAEAVELRQPNVYEAPKNLPKIESRSGQQEEADPAGYQRLAITSPEPDSAFWDNQGNFTLRLSLEPALDTAAGHSIRISLDGEVQGTTQKLQWQFTGVDRGTHSVRAEVVDESGRALIQSDPVSFHLHQQSINLPARRANP
ncbi:DUF4124 domain-containing protein [Thiohalobacter thiocyanaticus]|nr:DUF4124 domain-containing protein [Thiohalobacter thiocyanaticus]